MSFQKKLIIYTEEKITNIGSLFPDSKITIFDANDHKSFTQIPEFTFVNSIYSQLSKMSLYVFHPKFVSIVSDYQEKDLTALLLSAGIHVLVKIDDENQLDLLELIDSELYRLHQSLSDIWNANNELSYSIDLVLSSDALIAHTQVTTLLDSTIDEINIIALDIYRIFKEKFLIKEIILPEVY